MRYDDVVEWLESRPSAVRQTCLVAIDGHGGAGKSTLAHRLADRRRGATVIHTDDFANAGMHNGLNVERLLEQVIEPLSRDDAARYQRFDWLSQSLAEWRDVPAGGLFIVEGVSAMRHELARAGWDLTVWVETPREICLQRGLARDGVEAQHHWLQWFEQEDHYVAREDPASRADLVVSGAASVGCDPARELVVLIDRRSAS